MKPWEGTKEGIPRRKVGPESLSWELEVPKHSPGGKGIHKPALRIGHEGHLRKREGRLRAERKTSGHLAP